MRMMELGTQGEAGRCLGVGEEPGWLRACSSSPQGPQELPCLPISPSGGTLDTGPETPSGKVSVAPGASKALLLVTSRQTGHGSTQASAKASECSGEPAQAERRADDVAAKSRWSNPQLHTPPNCLSGRLVNTEMIIVLPSQTCPPDAKQSRSRTHRTIPERWEHPNVHQPVSG